MLTEHAQRGLSFALVGLLLALAGCSGTTSVASKTTTSSTAGTSSTGTSATPSAVAPAITTQPANQTAVSGQTATFSVVATGTAPLSYQWQKSGANISGATSSTYTTPAVASADNGASFRVVVTNGAGSVTSNSATLTVVAALPSGTDVTTFHNDNARTGQNLTETMLDAGQRQLADIRTAAQPLRGRQGRRRAALLVATASGRRRVQRRLHRYRA